MGQPVVQWQLLVKDPDASAAFYGRLFGWRIADSDSLGYRSVDTGSPDGIQGGIWPSPPGANFVQLFIRVDSIADHVRRAEELGARVLVPAQTLPQGDTIAVLQDPLGIAFGLVSQRA